MYKLEIYLGVQENRIKGGEMHVGTLILRTSNAFAGTAW